MCLGEIQPLYYTMHPLEKSTFPLSSPHALTKFGATFRTKKSQIPEGAIHFVIERPEVKVSHSRMHSKTTLSGVHNRAGYAVIPHGPCRVIGHYHCKIHDDDDGEDSGTRDTNEADAHPFIRWEARPALEAFHRLGHPSAKLHHYVQALSGPCLLRHHIWRMTMLRGQ